MLCRAACRHSPAPCAGLGVVILAAAALPLFLAIISGLLVAGLYGQSGAERIGAGGVVSGAVIALGVLFLLQQLLTPLGRALAETAGRQLGRATADRVMAAISAPARLERVDDPHARQLLSAVGASTRGTECRDAVVGTVNVSIIRGGAALSGLVLVAYRWWLGIAMIITYASMTLIVSRGYQKGLLSAEGAPARLRRAMYLKDLVSTAAAAKEVRVFGLADWLVGGYQQEWRTAMAGIRRERGGAGRIGLVSAAVVLVAQSATFLLLALDMRDGHLSPGAFTTFAIAATGLLSMNAVTPDLVSIATGGAVLAAAGDLERWTAQEPSPGVHATPRSGSIRLDGVGFRYPGSSEWVLRDLDLTIPAGRSIAIVGVNGAGKTTLVKLLCGLYQPTEGTILAAGVDLSDVDPGDWQRRFAALFQDWVHWGLSVRDNVLLGAPHRIADAGALDRVADASGLSGVLAELPDGWDTVLSREFGGTDLSGGQWQRVGLARALWSLTCDADILVLDEPTAALDVRGEAELFDLLLDVTADRTVVLISHRFSTVRRADQIVVLENGRVAERGSHDALLAANGKYALMFGRQAERFTSRTVIS
ncbi:MAG: ABC transporter ATP-binding protein [Streptosporangiaceae bacterium]